MIKKNDSIGLSLEGRDIKSFCISDFEFAEHPKAEALFTGLHHARETMSLTMNIYLFTKLLFDFYHDRNNTELFLRNKFCIIPAVNVDGYNYIEEIYRNSGRLTSIRKNRKQTGCNKYKKKKKNKFGFV